MYKIKIFPIVSVLHDELSLKSQTNKIIEDIKGSSNDYDIDVTTDLDNFYNGSDLNLILVQSGGSENQFLKILNKLKGPYYLLTYGTNNSLAASLEILAFLNKYNLQGEVLHGNKEYLQERISTLIKNKNTEIKCKYHLGVIGKPSDWLISSDVDYNKVKDLFSIELVDIQISELEQMYNTVTEEEIKYNFEASWDKKELNKAYKLYIAIKKIVDKYHLNGFTIRCFDLLSSLKTTACLALSIFNSEKDFVASCEGDITSLLGMFIAKNELHLPAFQCNPSLIDVKNNEILLAHCTLPLCMCSSYKFNTHFESNIGVGIKGELQEGDITIFRINSNLNKYYIEEGKLERNLCEHDLCRTQIVLKINNLQVLLEKPLGNHMLVLYGSQKKELTNYLQKRGFKEIK